MKKILFLLFSILPILSFADTYYWVNGSGNWSDINHWVTSSGGNVYHTQLPGSNDDVFFDSNSGLGNSDTVFFTVLTNFVHDISINIPSSKPTFYGSGNKVLRVFGSFLMQTSVKWDLKGTLFFESVNSGEIINVKDSLGSILFNANGSWILSDSLVVNSITMVNGSLTISPNVLLRCDTIDIKGNSQFNLNANSLELAYLTVDNTASFKPNSASLFVHTPPGSSWWNRPRINYYSQDSIHFSKIQGTRLEGSLNNVDIDSLLFTSDVDLTFYSSKIYALEASQTRIQLYNSEIIYKIKSNSIEWFALFNNSSIPSLESNNSASICIQSGSKVDSIVVASHLRIHGNNHIKTKFIEAGSMTVDYVCSGGNGLLSANNVRVFENTEITYPVDFDTLVIQASSKILVGNSASRFGYLEASAPCDSLINIESSISYTPRIIVIDSGLIQNTVFRDIINNSTPQFLNGGDTVRSTGFITSASNVETYYWINGSGNWSDLSHWSSTSGGIADKSCIPSLGDSVILDNNSLNGTNWTISLDNETIDIGSFRDKTNNRYCQFNVSTNSGSVIFRTESEFLNKNSRFSNSTKIVLGGKGANSKVFSKPEIDNIYLNSLGNWILIDTLSADNFYFIQGKLVQNGNVFSVKNLLNDREEHNQSITGAVDWNLKNSTAIIDRINFVGGQYITKPDNSELFLGSTNQRNNDSLNFHYIICSNNGTVDFAKGIWHANSLKVQGSIKVRDRINVDTLDISAPAVITASGSLKEYRVGHFISDATCSNRINFLGPLKWVQTDSSQTINYGNFKDVEVVNDSLLAISSTDLNGNQNIYFTSDLPRTLYWVGDGGSWNDGNHWSLTSGGVGGECLPTPADSVVFDVNSFLNNRSVDISGSDAYAHDIIIDSSGWTVFSGNSSLRFFGSLLVFDSIYVNHWNNTWIGNTDNSDSIYIAAGQLAELRLEGKHWKLVTRLVLGNRFRNYADSTVLMTNSSLELGSSWYHNIYNYGNFYTNSDSIETRYFYNYGIWSDSGSYALIHYRFQDNGIILNNSSQIRAYRMNLYGVDSVENSFYQITDVLDVSNNSYFKNDSITVSRYLRIDGQYSDSNTFFYLKHNFNGNDVELHKSTPDTVGNIKISGVNQVHYYHNGVGPIKKLDLLDNTKIYGNPIIDSLTLYEGNTYEIEKGKTLKLNESFESKGSFCDFLYLRSTEQGTRAFIDSDFQIFTNFCEYRDIEYIGSSTYFAGAQSTNQGNNYNLLWDNIPGYIWGFPDDSLVFFCNDSSVYSEFVLGTETFENAVSFLWDDGSDSTHRIITQSGLYSVTAFYATCSYTDSIQVDFVFKPEILTDKYAVCTGTSVQVYSNTPDDVVLQWSNGSTTDTSSFVINTDTTIIAEWFRGGEKLCADTIFVEGVEIDSIVTSIIHPSCAESLNGQIDINNISGGHGPYTHNWSFNPSIGSASSISTLASGCYEVITTDTLGCYRTDTLCLQAPAPLTADFSLVQPICKGDFGSITLGAIGGTPNYIFNYSFDTSSLPNGNYSFTVLDSNGCQTDTAFDINHTYFFDYSVIIDTATCGESNGAIQIIPGSINNAYGYTWSSYPGYTNNGQIFMPVSNGFIYIEDSITGCLDTLYYEIPSAGLSNAIFLTDQDSGVSPLTVTTNNLVTSMGLQYYWILDGDTVSTAQDTVFTFEGYGEYLITLCVYDSMYGCEFCFDKLIKVLPNPKIEVPNFFTPNFDGTNDFFEPVVAQDLEYLNVEIYNRWDELVFSSNIVDFQWDGRSINGLESSPGVYFWIIQYKRVGNTSPESVQGSVHLIR